MSLVVKKCVCLYTRKINIVGTNDVYYIMFSTRGLVLDTNKGDFVKLSKDGKVIRYA